MKEDFDERQMSTSAIIERSRHMWTCTDHTANSYMTITLTTVVLLLLLFTTGLASDTTKTLPADPAQGEEVNWQVISSGGTEGASAHFVLRGTLGQTAVGYGSSANYGLSHGYWQEFGPTTCCNHDGIRGDVDASNSINVADDDYLVQYLFFEGPAPPCEDPPLGTGNYPEANVDAIGGVNVADQDYLIQYLFFNGPAPAVCP